MFICVYLSGKTRDFLIVQLLKQVPISPEVHAHTETERERAFEAVNAEAEQKWWRKLGAKVLDVVRGPECEDVSREIVPADEVVDRRTIEALARQLIENYEMSPKMLRENEAEDNARTALFEALTANGHMSVVELAGDQSEVHGQVLQRLLNSYFRPGIPEAEKARNFEEICEELVVQAIFERIQTGEAPPDIRTNTVSDFAHSLGSEAQKLGYRPSDTKSYMGKGMVRETSFEMRNGQWVRIIKQISRSNTFAPDTVSKLQKAGLRLPPRSGSEDIQLLGSQILSVSHGALEVTQLLDRMQRGAKVMYGQSRRSGLVPYERLEIVSKQREEAIESHIQELANYERVLDGMLKDGNINQQEHLKHYAEALREHVRAICVQYPAYTRGALGEKVVEDYARAHERFEAGDASGAASIIGGASGRELAVVACGMSTEAQNNDPNNPNANNEQTAQKILERELMKDWDKITNCPICGNKGVSAKKRGDIITDNTYGCTLNVCTGDAKIGAGALIKLAESSERKEDKPSTSGHVESPDSKLLNEEYVKQIYGADARLQYRRKVGDAVFEVVSVKTGVILNPDLKQGDYALGA